MNERWSSEEEKLQAALHAAAQNVSPGPDGLARIRRRTAESPWWRNPVFYGVAAGVATAAAAVVIAVNTLGTGADDLSVSPADSPTSSQTSVPSQEPTTGPVDPTDADPTRDPDDDPGDDPESEPIDPAEEPDETEPPATAERMALPVYFTVDGQVNREWQSVTGTDPLLAAADASLNGTSFDPRYESLWSPVEVISAEVVDGVIEVDLRSPVELDADPELADEAVQQLVYTVTATAAMPLVPEVDGAVPVRILVDGAPADDLFGSVDVSEPVTRADQIDVRYLIDIDSPAYGADVSSPVTVSGVAAVFEGNALWELRRDGEVVDSGITQTEEAFTFSPFSIELGDLEPGTYEITVMEDDVSDGEGPEPRFETKEFTVVAP
ncbi:hypothetical protein G1H11_22945 [Phytoactinopolyspora alkaliphila]|uniref:GerMN domain-containing protein n=1 Tax=Phytoactinopolyspora alkaliphila TaxID=1783498 RepID=A0A6N9YSZ6_9ACTN|nr:hypothetical protein [Phytoactinopolyspora alkaliphila]